MDLSPKKISIVVPCYNQAGYLDECLQSVLDQSYGNWECIVVDDGSPDNTEEVAQKWLKKDSRFQYYKKENGGVCSARNFGIEKSTGEWILPLDGDDKIAEKYLELAANEFSENIDIIYCKGNYFGSKNDEMLLSDFDETNILLENQIFCSAFFKKKDWKKIGGYDETMHNGYEDWDFWLSLIAIKEQSISVKKLNYPGFYYRIKDISRNTEAIGKHDIELRNYIFTKHVSLYQKHIAAISEILRENKKLKSKINHYETLLNSKRYKFLIKVSNLFKF